MFDDIRPYNDDEITQVIESLINSTALQDAIATMTFPKLYKLAPSLMRFAIKYSLKFRAKKFNHVDAIQQEVAKYLHQLIAQSTDGFHFSGIENINKDKPALFISNHRDIVLDVALLNLALFKNNLATVEAAVGDNLLEQQWVADLMRINKSFIVKRNIKNKREMLMASKQLSAYIHDSIVNRQQNIWIAQREGRAKDGIDQTNPAVISMLLLNKPKQTTIAQYLSQLNIIPVSISYEFDPCDQQKAIELGAKEQYGSYQKKSGEDLDSITQGMKGYKGKIHLTFGRAITGEHKDSKSIAQALDQEIINNYHLFDTNITANKLLNNDENINEQVAKQLTQRMKNLTALQQQWLLTMYANPVKRKQACANDFSN